jgi:hypothetical protein
MRIRGIKSKPLVEELKEKRRHRSFGIETLTLWRSRFGRTYGIVRKQAIK